MGLDGKICDTLNEIISLNEEMMLEFTRAGNTIGKQGKLTHRIDAAEHKGVNGARAWNPQRLLFPIWFIRPLKLHM